MAKSWIKEPKEVPISNLKKASIICYKNGCNLLDDSKVLLDNSSYSSSVVMSILAEEEFSKAALLHSCVTLPRWDSAIWKGLISHGAKQATAEVMRQFINKTDSINQVTYNSIQTSINEISEPVKNSHIEKREVDKVKQSKLYVTVDREGEIENIPSSSEVEALSYIHTTNDFKSIVEQAYIETAWRILAR